MNTRTQCDPEGRHNIGDNSNTHCSVISDDTHCHACMHIGIILINLNFVSAIKSASQYII